MILRRILDWRLNKEQRDGLGRIFDGYAIASGVAVYTAIGGHLILAPIESIALVSTWIV
ncbi:MAG: hypothetical protein ORO03_06575 [Alphaproteobacteria bacterium]|nr:hypothetical protein [Alphaproteobacteria bacterium]